MLITSNGCVGYTGSDPGVKGNFFSPPPPPPPPPLPAPGPRLQRHRRLAAPLALQGAEVSVEVVRPGDLVPIDPGDHVAGAEAGRVRRGLGIDLLDGRDGDDAPLQCEAGRRLVPLV